MLLQVNGPDPRSALKALVADRPGESLASLSRLIGRNDAYLQQWAERGSPRVLAERDRALLARYLGVGEDVLGGPVPPPATVRVPRRDARASAGPGAVNEGEVVVGELSFSPAQLRALGGRGPYSVIRAAGDSMAPGIGDGDELLVDEGDRAVGRPGVHVVRIEGTVLVKRVRRGATGLLVASDNPDARPVPPGAVEVIGRVLWLGRAVQ